MGHEIDELRRVFRRHRHGRTFVERIASHVAEWRYRRRVRRW